MKNQTISAGVPGSSCPREGRQGVVTAARSPLMSAPALESEQVDELLLGWSVTVLSCPAPCWYRVRSAYGYEGYAPAASLCAAPGQAASLCAAPGQAAAWDALPKQVVTKAFCSVLAAPKVQSWPVAELTRGALVALLSGPNGDGWVKIALPDGKQGYIKCSNLSEYYKNTPYHEADFRKAVTQTALSYLGTHYRWGGKSPLGIDCSGLAFMSYWLNGVSIFRDARIEPGFPVHEIPRDEMKQGDLLYFPGHMAVYLGDGEYVHSTARTGSDGVVINSLDPSSALYREDLARSLTAVGSIFPA